MRQSPASAAFLKYSKDTANELRGQMVRVSTDFGAGPIKAKIANAEQLRVHTMLVIGGRDMEAARQARVTTTAARKAQSRRGKSWQTFWRRFGSGERKFALVALGRDASVFSCPSFPCPGCFVFKRA